jgi:hypothetical protein
MTIITSTVVTVAAAAVLAASPASASDEELILDYTLYVEGATQVSGIDTSADGSQIAVVTDLEHAFIFGIEEFAVTDQFTVQLGDLPRQGSTEAIAFTSPDEVAVLYPDVSLIRRYGTDGEIRAEIDLSSHELDLAGAMTRLADGTLLVATTDPAPTLVAVDADGTTARTVDVTTDIGEIAGLTTGPGDSVYAVTEDGVVLAIDLGDGATTQLPSISAVGEPSDIEYFVTPDDEAVLAITDDADEYNGTEGPIRLFLLP